VREADTDQALPESEGERLMDVKYLKGGLLVHRTMNQAELAELLTEPDVVLLSVNQGKVYTGKKKCRRG
jgi:hypothetical protein